MSKSFAIIGAGNGGQAFAAYLSLKGHSVKIYDVSQKTVDILQEKGGVLLEGNSDVVGFGKIMLASTDRSAMAQNQRPLCYMGFRNHAPANESGGSKALLCKVFGGTAYHPSFGRSR